MDAAEYFWQLQRPPTAEEVDSILEWPHPHVRGFKKLSVLPSFGVSKVKRPVADIVKHLSEEVTEASSKSKMVMMIMKYLHFSSVVTSPKE